MPQLPDLDQIIASFGTFTLTLSQTDIPCCTTRFHFLVVYELVQKYGISTLLQPSLSQSSESAHPKNGPVEHRKLTFAAKSTVADSRCQGRGVVNQIFISMSYAVSKTCTTRTVNLQAVLDKCEGSLFRSIATALGDPGLDAVQQACAEYLDTNVGINPKDSTKLRAQVSYSHCLPPTLPLRYLNGFSFGRCALPSRAALMACWTSLEPHTARQSRRSMSRLKR